MRGIADRPPNRSFQQTRGMAPRKGLGRQIDLNTHGGRFLSRPAPLNSGIVKEQLYIGGDGLPWQNPLKFAELSVSRALFFFNTARLIDRPYVARARSAAAGTRPRMPMRMPWW